MVGYNRAARQRMQTRVDPNRVPMHLDLHATLYAMNLSAPKPLYT